MSDRETTLAQLKAEVKQFVEEREWQQFHSLKSLSMNLVREATELMEIFTWVDGHQESMLEYEKKKEKIHQEAADVLYALLNFCNQANIDLTTACQEKMILNAKKYPVEKAKGNRLKHNEL